MKDLQATVTGLIQSAVSHYNTRKEASDAIVTDLYEGVKREYEGLGDLSQVEGRSSSMSTDIRDAVLHIMPRILRSLLGSGKVIRFEPEGPWDGDADLLTEMVRTIISRDNRGYMELYSAIKDALVRDCGWMRVHWQPERPGAMVEYKGVTQEQAMGLASQPGVEDYQIGEPYQAYGSEEPVFDCMIRRNELGRVTIEAVPGEEMFYDARARSIHEADCIVHLRRVPADAVVALGYDPETVAEYARKTSAVQNRMAAKRFGETETSVHEDESRRPVMFADAWIRVDTTGDGLSELRHFHCIGEEHRILNGTGIAVERVPVSQFRSIPVEHTMHGVGHGTLLADVQIQKSLMERGLINAQARALDSRLVIKEDAVRYEDVIEAKGLHDPIRVMGYDSVVDAVTELKTQYMGEIALQGLDYLNQKRADRSGMARAAEGKDSAALQSTTQQAVSETFARADSMTVLVLSTLAEEGMRDLYELIAHTLARKQDYVRRIVLSNGQFAAIGPSVFNVKRECRVTVRGWDTVRELEYLGLILSLQQSLMQEQSPLVSEIHMAATLRGIVEATGRTDASKYIAPWGPEQQQAYDQQKQQQAEAQPPPIEQQVVDVEKAKMLMEDDRKREEISVDAALKEMELAAKYNTDLINERLEMFRAKIGAEQKEKSSE